MKKIAIVGVGPTGIYTFFALLKSKVPLSLSLYEQAPLAGVGMPYGNKNNTKMMLANIASIEIPPLFCTYIDWLRNQSEAHLARYGVHPSSLHIRQFLPRILLGEYFRDQFLQLVAKAKQRGFEVNIYESCQVTDLKITPTGVRLWAAGKSVAGMFDLTVITTGHVWPQERVTARHFFPCPWSGLIEASIPACNIGVLGTSLSGIDAAMAVAAQHGDFIEAEEGQVVFKLATGSKALNITLMSRSGILPEADFYCPLPYEPLSIVTKAAIHNEVARGSTGLLDRVFQLMVKEIDNAAPAWSEYISLGTLNADSFVDSWFAERKKHDPFHWAESNLHEVERNKHNQHTVPWRYVILRLHEIVQDIVPHLDQHDNERFSRGLARVFIDNYAAVPPQSIRRLLALREAGVISILELGADYKMDVNKRKTVIATHDKRYQFDIFIDARGQMPMKINDLPFPTLREQLASTGEDIPDVGNDYTLQQPAYARGRIAFGALPYLIHDRPFIQGLAGCAEVGTAIAKAASQPAIRYRKRLPFIDV